MDESARERSLAAGLVTMFWSAAMVGFGEGSFSLFAAHIHANNLYFGLLAGMPLLFGPLTQVLGANWLEIHKTRKRIVLRCVFLQSLVFIPLCVLALCSNVNLMQKVYLPILLLYFIAGHFASPAWNSWISELCPSGRRAQYFSGNARSCGIMTVAGKGILLTASYLAAWNLASTETDDGTYFRRMAFVFVIMFAVAGVMRHLSWRNCRKMFEAPYEPPHDASFTLWQFVRRAPESNFVKFVFFISVFHFGAFVSAPFYISHVLNVLHRPAWHWVVIEIGSAVSAALTFIYWGAFSARFGNKATLGFTSLLMSAIPALWILFDHFAWLALIQCMAGALWAGFGLSFTNYIMEASSPAKRARCFAYFNIFVGAGCFLGSMAGYGLTYIPASFTLFGINVSVRDTLTYVFIASALLRAIPALFMIRLFRELRTEVHPFSIRGWAYEIVGPRFPVGLRIDAIGGKENDSESGEGK